MCVEKSHMDMGVVYSLHIQHTVHTVCIYHNDWIITHYTYLNTKKGGGIVLEYIHHIPRI